MEGSHRDPRAQKHREAERRHREKLAENLDSLRSVLPGVSPKEQKAEIFAKASAYIRYLRQFVPQEKWLPPATSMGGPGYEESEASAFDEAVEETPMHEIVSHPTGPAYMMQAPMYGMQYMQHGAPQMQGMAVGMVPSALPMGPLPSSMFYFSRDGRTMPSMAPINMSMGALQYAMAPMPMGPAPAEDAGAENRKRKHFSADGSRSGTSDSTGGPAADATAFGSIRKPIQMTKEESGSASAEMFVQRSSHRRRRRVDDDDSLDSEDNDRATQVHESETAFLDALASIAASSSQDYTAGISTSSREPVSEYKMQPLGPANVSPRSLVSPATHNTMEGLSHLTLSRSHTAPVKMAEAYPERYTGQAYYRHPGQVPPPTEYIEHHRYAMLPDVTARPTGRPLPKISHTHARMVDQQTADPSYGGSADTRFVHDPARATLRRTSNYGDHSQPVY